MKKSDKNIQISKLTNLFFGIAIGFGLGYKGGTVNLVIAAIFIAVTIILAFVYKIQK